MSKAAQLALLSMVGLMSGLQMEQPTQIRSYKIKQKKEEGQQLSKRAIQKMKSKNNRKNRGRNRSKNKPQDTAIYASLRK